MNFSDSESYTTVAFLVFVVAIVGYTWWATRELDKHD